MNLTTLSSYSVIWAHNIKSHGQFFSGNILQLSGIQSLKMTWYLIKTSWHNHATTWYLANTNEPSHIQWSIVVNCLKRQVNNTKVYNITKIGMSHSHNTSTPYVNILHNNCHTHCITKLWPSAHVSIRIMVLYGTKPSVHHWYRHEQNTSILYWCTVL